MNIMIASIASAIVTYITSLFIIYIEKRFNIMCRDMHKPYDYLVPCIGGIPLYLGIIVGITLLHMFNVIRYNVFASLSLSTTISLVIGFLDDMYNLKSRWKISLGFLPSLPILAMECYIPKPWLPFLGHTRLYIVYPIFVLLASTVYINGANMIDTHNGILPMFILIVTIFTSILKIYSGTTVEEVAILIIIIIATVIYLWFNAYPAKLFNGNTGAFIIGSILTYITIFFRVEFYMVLVSIPMLLNGFYYISSVKGFIQKEKVNRPTYLDKNGCIYPSKQLHPITFIKIILVMSKKPLSEKELIKFIYLIYLATASLSTIICILLGYS